MVKGGTGRPVRNFLSAFMALQTITGAETGACAISKISGTVENYDPVYQSRSRSSSRVSPMLQFLSVLFEVVLPSLKDFTGVADTTGDTNGNLAFGLPPLSNVSIPGD
ncbi:hypothetical protein MRB53_040826 [Persea americana]|nr:hypothetical protein MRB53_040826 [Persea americana]